MRALVMTIFIMSLLVFFGSCKSASQNKRIAEVDSILLQAIKDFDTSLGKYDTMYVIGMFRDFRSDTTVIRICHIGSPDIISSFKLKFLYQGYRRPVFSSFLFIQTENQDVIKNTLKKYFPRTYYTDIIEDSSEAYVSFMDGYTYYYVELYKNKLIKKYISRIF